MDSSLTMFACGSSSDALGKLAEMQFATATPKLLSIIVPARNEAENLAGAYDEITEALAGKPYLYEVIVIDNASSDGTGELAAGYCVRDPRWRYISFSRDFGLEASLAAGFRLARGNAAMVVFADLQDPPHLIDAFVQQWLDGSDVVYGVVRRRTGDPIWRSLAAKAFYHITKWLADSDVPLYATDFRLLSRRAIDAVNQFDERNRYMRGYSHWIGLRQSSIVYDRRPRIGGKSKAPFWYLVGYAIDAITCFSIKSLRLFSVFGLATLAVVVPMAIFFLARYLMGISIPGTTTIVMLLLAILGVMLLGFGTVGEYVGRIYLETKRRPLFVVEKAINLASDRDSRAVIPTSTVGKRADH